MKQAIITVGIIAALPAAALHAETARAEAPLYATSEDGASMEEAVHTVIIGDTLWTIADRYYGDPFQWGRLYGANPDKISDPDQIYPGEEISVPESAGEEAPASEGVSQMRPMPGPRRTDMSFSGGGTSGRDIFPISDYMPADQQEWTGKSLKIVPRKWKGSGIIVGKVCEGDDSLSEGLTEVGDKVLIKTGNPSMFRSGDTLASYIVGAPAYDAETGREAGIKLQKSGVLEVLGVRGNIVTARVVKAVTSVDKGQLVTQ